MHIIYIHTYEYIAKYVHLSIVTANVATAIRQHLQLTITIYKYSKSQAATAPRTRKQAAKPAQSACAYQFGAFNDALPKGEHGNATRSHSTENRCTTKCICCKCAGKFLCIGVTRIMLKSACATVGYISIKHARKNKPKNRWPQRRRQVSVDKGKFAATYVAEGASTRLWHTDVFYMIKRANDENGFWRKQFAMSSSSSSSSPCCLQVQKARAYGLPTPSSTAACKCHWRALLYIYRVTLTAVGAIFCCHCT